MRCLVTGAKGLLGTYLVADLRRLGEEVVEWDLPQHDVTDVEKTINGIHVAGPEVIFHCAAWTDVDGCEKDHGRAMSVNSQGAWAVALGAEELGCKMVYISTDYVFDGRATRPYREDDKPNPLSVYGRSKLMGEKAVERSCKKRFIVRTSWLYGAHGRNFVDTIRRLAGDPGLTTKTPRHKGADSDEPPNTHRIQTEGVLAEAKPVLEVVSDQVGAPTFAQDLCEPLALMARTDKFGTYHLTGTGSCSWFELAQEIVRLTGAKCEVKPIDTAKAARPAPRPAYSVLDCGRFRKRFGHTMRPWSEALADYLAERTRNHR